MSLTRTAILLVFAMVPLSCPPFAQQPTQPATIPSAPTPARDSEGNYQVGGSVTPPRVIFAPEPEFSEKARKKKIAGDCIVGLVVDVTGHVMQAHVVRSIGEDQVASLQDAARSLDEKALKAVLQYRFEPATLDGRPVPVKMTIKVNFQIF